MTTRWGRGRQSGSVCIRSDRSDGWVVGQVVVVARGHGPRRTCRRHRLRDQFHSTTRRRCRRGATRAPHADHPIGGGCGRHGPVGQRCHRRCLSVLREYREVMDKFEVARDGWWPPRPPGTPPTVTSFWPRRRRDRSPPRAVGRNGGGSTVHGRGGLRSRRTSADRFWSWISGADRPSWSPVPDPTIPSSPWSPSRSGVFGSPSDSYTVIPHSGRTGRGRMQWSTTCWTRPSTIIRASWPPTAWSAWPGRCTTLASLQLGLTVYDRNQVHHAVLTAGGVYDWYRTLASEVRRPGSTGPAAWSGARGRDRGRGADTGCGDDPIRFRRVPGVGGGHPRRDGGRAAGLIWTVTLGSGHLPRRDLHSGGAAPTAYESMRT